MVHFAYPLPWWGWLLAVVVIGLLAWWSYARPVVPIARGRRIGLAALRAVTLILLVMLLARPVRVVKPDVASDAIVPVLVDISRSMRLQDAGAERRIERAWQLVEELRPRLATRFHVEILTFGETLAPLPDPHTPPAADARRSDLTGALGAVRHRYRGRAVAGVLVISDGGDTGGRDAPDLDSAPVYAIGVGSSVISHDREVLSVTAGEAALADSTIDLTVAAVSHGYGTEPLDLRVLANGRPVEVRRVTPHADGSPLHEVFTVSPERGSATLYTVEITSDSADIAPENNSRGVVVDPPGRRRKLLLVEGAPGFEHSFIKRAWTADPGLEVDSVVRKGRNDHGNDTFFVMADPARSPALVSGYPVTREALFAYDAIAFGNVEAEYFTRDQLQMTAAFVAERGGGLLVLGARSFARQALAGTPIEEVLPVDLSDRRSSVVKVALNDRPEPNKVVVTEDGERHPLMRLVNDAAENRKRWAALPPLAGNAALGGPRAGAQVLAVTGGPGGSMRPVVAVQQYGKGRAMVFGGEASWRWRMLLPSTDRTHELFWRQAARWLSMAAPGPVAVETAAGLLPGDTARVDATVRNREFRPVANATVVGRVTMPGGATRDLKPTLADAANGRHATTFRTDQPGVYRVRVEAKQGNTALGAAEAWMLVGGVDQEFAEPRLNEEVLRRLALATGGRYARAEGARGLADALRSAQSDTIPPEVRDVWQTPWVIGLLVVLMSTEWTLRRRWGMR